MNKNPSDRDPRQIGRIVLLLRAAALVSVAAGGNAVAESPKEVTVEGTVDAVVVDIPPVDVYSLDNPAFTAYQASGGVSVGEGLIGVLNTPIAEVPEGTRLVIEYASVSCDTPAGNSVGSVSLSTTERTSPTSTTTRPFQIPLNDQGPGGFSEALFIGGLSTRLYSDPGSVSGGVLRASGTGVTICVFSIAGHTVPVDPSPDVASTERTGAPTTEPLAELILPYDGRLPPEALQPPDGTVVKLLAP